MTLATPATRRALRDSATRWLSGHRRLSPSESLLRLARSEEAALAPDHYGAGGAADAVAAEVAATLGKPAAVFVPKGVIAQLVALRVWAEQSGRNSIVLHRRSHIAAEEEQGYHLLEGLDGILIGDDRPFRPADLAGAERDAAAVVIEMPLRRAGFLLPDWSVLEGLRSWCDAHGAALHLDGARLWESAPFYGRAYADIAALFDTVYVSLYKGLGGLGGAVLAGPVDVVEQARPWLVRHGAFGPTNFPIAASGLRGLHLHLPELPRYVANARGLAAALGAVAGVRILPDPPHTNGFQIWMPGDPAALQAAADDVALRDGLWLFDTVVAAPVKSFSMAEIQIGDAFDDLSCAEIAAKIEAILLRTGT